MNRQMWTALALLLAGGLLWFGLGALEGSQEPDPMAPSTGDGVDESGGAQLSASGTGETPLEQPLQPHILMGRVRDGSGAPVGGMAIRAHALALPRPGRGRADFEHPSLPSLAVLPVASSERGASATTDGRGAFALGGLEEGEVVLLAGSDDAGRVLLGPLRIDDPARDAPGVLVAAEAVPVRLQVPSPSGVLVTASAARTVGRHGEPLFWHQPLTPPDAAGVVTFRAPPGPIRVWVHRRGRRHDVHALAVADEGGRYDLRALPDPARITVRVIDGFGNAVPRAHVAVWSGPKGPLGRPRGGLVLGETSEEGTAALESLVPAHATYLHVHARGHVQARGPIGRALERGEHLHLDVVLRPGTGLSGLVVGPGDVPLPGARVTLGRHREARTDADGTFRFDDVPLGRTTLAARATGYLWVRGADVQILVRPKASENVHRITLQRGAAIQGRVYRPDGTPAAHARVRPHAPSNDADPLDVGTLDVRADAEGRFTLAGLSPGRAWTVSTALDDLVSEPLPPFIPHVDQPSAELRIELRPAGLIAGHVRDSEGEPVEAQTVRLMPFSRYQKVGADGSFRFGSLPPGRYVVLLEQRRQLIDDFDLDVDREGKTRHEVEIEVGTQVTDLVLRAPSRAVLEGVLVDKDGTPVPGARVEIHDKERAWLHANPGGMFLVGDHGDTVTTDEAGHFRLAGLWGGELDYVIKVDGIVAGEKYRVPTPGLTIVKPERVGRTVTVQFRTPGGDPPPRGSFDWRLLTKDEDAWNGFEEVERGHVSALRGGDARLVLSTEGDHLEVDAAIWRLADGSLAPWHPVGRARLPIKGDTVHLALEQGGTLAGRVVDGDGKPVPHARVELAHENDWAEYGQAERVSRVSKRPGKPDRFSFPSKGDVHVRADASGQFRFHGLRDERCYLRAVGVAGKRGGDPVQASPGATNVEIRMHDAASIRGRVLDSDGRPIAMVKVGTSEYAWRDTVTTDAAGVFEVTGLEPGSMHTLYVHADDGHALPYLPHTEKRVRAGGPPLTIRLSEGVFLEGVVVDHAGASVLEGIVTAQRVGEPADDDAPSAGINREGNRFQLGPLAPGEYDLAIGSGWNQDIKVFRQAPLRVTAPARAIRLEVHRCWQLRGRVQGGKGYDWKVYWCPPEPIVLPGDEKHMMSSRPEDRRRTYLSADGTFSFDSVRERQGDLYVFGPGDEYALLRNVTSDSGELEIQLERGHSIGGRVEGAGKGRELRVRQGGVERTFETGEGGTFLVRGLPPGTWILEEYNKWPHIVVGPKRELAPAIQVEAGNTEIVYGAR